MIICNVFSFSFSSLNKVPIQILAIFKGQNKAIHFKIFGDFFYFHAVTKVYIFLIWIEIITKMKTGYTYFQKCRFSINKKKVKMSPVCIDIWSIFLKVESSKVYRGASGIVGTAFKSMAILLKFHMRWNFSSNTT